MQQFIAIQADFPNEMRISNEILPAYPQHPPLSHAALVRGTSRQSESPAEAGGSRRPESPWTFGGPADPDPPPRHDLHSAAFADTRRPSAQEIHTMVNPHDSQCLGEFPRA